MNEKLTPIEYLKQYLGVVDGEEFDVYYDGKDVGFSPYHFKGNKLYDTDNVNAHSVLGLLVNGAYQIKKKPFVPKYGETYYYFSNNEIYLRENYSSLLDVATIKCGWSFRTYEEAEANKERVLKEMKEVVK